MTTFTEIQKLIEEKNEGKLLSLYFENKKSFLNGVSSIFVKKDDVKKLEYLESLGMELDDKGHPLLWVCVQNSKPKAVRFLLKYLIKDSSEAIFCNKIIISSAITENEKNFAKRMKILPLIMEKISLESFNKIKNDINMNVKRYKGQELRDKFLTEIDYIYLNQELSKNNNNKKKNKI